MTPINEEVRHFSREAIKQITTFLKNNPDHEHSEVGIKHEAHGNYIWFRDWDTILPAKPVCVSCGQVMSEGTIRNPDVGMGYPCWFCESKECKAELISRYERELEEYRKSGGAGNALKTMLKNMNIPPSFYSKTLSNLKYEHKAGVRTDMKNKTNLLITGESGTGKTHLSVALLIEFGRYKSHKFRFESIPLMFADIQKRINNDEDYTKIIDDALLYDTLVLDDLGVGKTSDYRREVLHNIISGRGFEERQTIITTNMNMSQIKEEFDERLASRLNEYKLVKLSGVDHRRK